MQYWLHKYGCTTIVGLAAGLTVGCALEHDEGSVADMFDPGAVVDAAVEESRLLAESLAEAEAEAARAAAIAAENELGAKLGSFQFTYYWIAHEGDAARSTQLYDRKCKPVAQVSPAFAERLVREGTGKLRDGRVLNTSGTCNCDNSPCFFEVPRYARYGVGVAKRPLSPFRSVAVDPAEVPIGAMLYIAELDGKTMPGRGDYGGFVHDGCVIADDRGGGVKGHQIDFFTARRHHYTAFDRRHRLKLVTVYDGKGRCMRKGRKVVAAANRNSI